MKLQINTDKNFTMKSRKLENTKEIKKSNHELLELYELKNNIKLD